MPARRSPLDRLRERCLALPEAHEVPAWGEPTFRVRKKIFAMYASASTHHGQGRPGVWCKSTLFTQDQMLRAEPERYFRPPYVGPKGWIGVFLDGRPDWAALDAVLRDAWRLTAPKRLLSTLDAD
ncbi:MAG: hypothetical protein JWN79_2190 [Gemmatimonadetes bacterium]|jgi:hypothetical protein|nr:hypothetical protein [Gemmatimonadota bacterium]